MLKNYLTVAWRTLRRDKVHTAVNVFGLAVGLAACILIALYVQDERSFDRFHEKSGRIHRVVAEGNAAVGPPVAPALEQDFPALVERAARLWPIQAPATFRYDGQALVERNVSFADVSVFDVFTFPMTAGDPRTALAAPFSMVMTERTAQKYFGAENPLGRSVEMWGRPFEVTGVVADIPPSTHYPVDVLVSMASLPAYLSGGMMQNWGWAGFYTYALLREGAPAETLEAALPAFYARHTPEAPAAPRLQRLTDIHLRSDLEKEAAPPGNASYVYLLAAAALLVLVIACVNFATLATARATGRAKEVGMRKTLGATRRQIAAQFLGEAVLLSLAALAVAVLLVQLALPLFNGVAGKELALHYREGRAAGALLTLAVLTGLVAGSYPAVFLSAFPPTRVLKGQLPSRLAGAGLRRGLVAFQFALSTVLLVGVAVVHQQLGFLQSADLGFAKEHLVAVEAANYDALREELAGAPEIRAVSAAYGVPGRRFQRLPFRTAGMAPDSTRLMRWLGVDYGFVRAMGIEMVAGRAFSKARGTDAESGFLINEAAARAFGWTDPLGKEIAALNFSGDGASFEVVKEGRVVGVTKNFRYASLHTRPEPLVMSVARGEDLNLAVIRMREGQTPAALARIEATWKRANPDDLYFHLFLDALADEQYRAEARLGRVFGGFAGLAVLLAGLGLFGVAAASAEARTKEIGIRRALGASARSIVALVAKESLALVAVGFALAAPVAWLAARRWLEGFAYRAEPGAALFLAAGLALLAVALVATSGHALKAARANPAEALRDE